MKRFLLLGPVAVIVAVLGVAALPGAGAQAVTRAPQAGATSARCAIAEQRLGDRLSQLQAVSDRRSAAYEEAHKNITAKLSNLSKAGYDIAKLTASLQTAQQELVDYRTKAEALAASLQSAQTAACSDSDAGFKQSLVQARQDLKTVREAARKIHQTYSTRILPDIRAAAVWLRDNTKAQGN